MADANPTAPNPSCATGDELHALVCDSGTAMDLLDQTVAIMQATLTNDAPAAALIRLVEAVAQDVRDVHRRLDRLWLDTPATSAPAAAPAPLPTMPDELDVLDRAAFQLAFAEEMASADPKEPVIDVTNRAMARVRAFLAERAALPQKAA